MALRLFTESTGWDTGRAETLHTRSAVHASGVHPKLVTAIDKVLGGWHTLDLARRAANDEVVAANARVRYLDARLDAAVNRLAGQVLAETGRDRTHPLFVAFFPHTPSHVIRMGLENEIAATAKFRTIADERKVSKAIRAIVAEIDSIRAEGLAALDARKTAAAEASRVSVRVATWKENANEVRRTVHHELEAHAIKNGLPRDYADAFFPAMSRSRTSTPPPPPPPPPDTTTPAPE